jgi:hypothetical protein
MKQLFYLYPFFIEMYNQQTTNDQFQVPSGMMLVPAPQQHSQPYPTVSQYQPPTMAYNNSSVKNNKVAPPPYIHNSQPVNQMFPTNCIII